MSSGRCCEDGDIKTVAQFRQRSTHKLICTYVVGLGPVLSLFNGTPPYRGRPYYNIRVRKTRSCFTWPTHSSARREIHRLVYCKHHVKSSVACYRIVLHRYRHVADLYSSLTGDCSIQRTKICKSILLNSPLDVHFG